MPTSAAGEADGLASVSGAGLISPTLSTSFSDHATVSAGTGNFTVTPAVIMSSNIVASASATHVAWGHVATELIEIDESFSAVNGRFTASASSIAKVAAAVQVALSATISQNVNAHMAWTVALGLTLLGRVKATPAWTLAAIYHLSLTQAILAGGAVQAFFGRTLHDNAIVSSSELTTYIGAGRAADHAVVSATFSPQFIFSATASDSVVVSDRQLLKMIFNGQLSDNIQIGALYVSPTGETTTWVMNTRTNALTEYRNWSFNSFAQMGRKYIAADQTGLYELDGEKDFGANIASIVRSGYMQWNASRLSGLKAAYLGMRTDSGGDFVFKLIGGDGQEYAYSVSANPNLMTTKIDIGKGLRTRYFAFELDGLGADYDLDSVEFVPLMQQRRI